MVAGALLIHYAFDFALLYRVSLALHSVCCLVGRAALECSSDQGYLVYVVRIRSCWPVSQSGHALTV